MAIISQIVYAAGVLALTYAAYQVVVFSSTFLRPSRLHLYHHGPQPWACITGASDGIGKGMAEELASHNFNLILHGRNASKLAAVKSSIQALNPAISIRIFLFDTNEYKPIASSTLPALIQDLNITILINNVGLGYETTTPAAIDAQINTNLRFTTQLTHFLLPTLQSRPGPSLVLTMGSTTAIGMPFVSVYAGAKAYLRTWSRSMGMQQRAEGHDAVEFLTLDIVEVSTLGNSMGVSFLRPTARAWSRCALRRVGYGRRYAHGYWPHAIQRAVVGWMTEDVQDALLLPEMMRRREALGKTK
jgi:17beta-estradiol 17-dehydrogenase / very-long-chain 3-oxoacyl-CoA reductase